MDFVFFCLGDRVSCQPGWTQPLTSSLTLLSAEDYRRAAMLDSGNFPRKKGLVPGFVCFF